MSDDSEPKKVTHRVEIDRTPEIDSLHKEIAEKDALLAEKQAILEQAALAEVERMKDELSAKYPQASSLIKSCATPQQIEDLKSNLRDSYGSGKHAPYGKASLTPKKGEDEYESQAQMVDSLYDKAYYNSQKYSKEEVEDAKQKIETLLRSMLGSNSWKELREHGTGKIETHKLSACPKCHYTLIDTNKCPNCGYDATEKQKVRD